MPSLHRRRNRAQSDAMENSPYLFPAADHPLRAVTDRLRVREAISGLGIALRYQERAPDPPGTPEAAWCETGHSIFILCGRISYRFDNHTIEAGPAPEHLRQVCDIVRLHGTAFRPCRFRRALLG